MCATARQGIRTARVEITGTGIYQTTADIIAAAAGPLTTGPHAGGVRTPSEILDPVDMLSRLDVGLTIYP